MKRTPLVAGNWKMNNDVVESNALIDALLLPLSAIGRVEVVLCPPFIALAGAAERLRGSRVRLGAQNMHQADKGAHTGEISGHMLKGLVRYVIIGHSERRHYFAESDEIVHQKVHAAVKHDLIPILCVGENFSQYETGETSAVIGRQVRAALHGVAPETAARIVVAYEPIWAIGTGKSASGASANAVIGLTIRGALGDLFGEACAQSVRVLYGGSVTPANIAEFVQQPDIDGGLIGGASLKADDFVKIVEAAATR